MRFLLLLFISLPLYAFVASQSKEEFCRDRRDKNFVKELTQGRNNLMYLGNHGGILGEGVCWWHSRFQRNALYLTYYSPNEPRPDAEEAKKIIKDIREQNGIVKIPGYANFYDFSNQFMFEIQRELEAWQKADAHAGAWRDGLRGKPVVAPEKMESLMNELYEEVGVKNNIAYEKLQLRGLGAHAWLVVYMTKTYGGYDLEVIDSNFPGRLELYHYSKGDTHFNNPMGAVTPYLEQTEEMTHINDIIQKNCF